MRIYMTFCDHLKKGNRKVFTDKVKAILYIRETLRDNKTKGEELLNRHSSWGELHINVVTKRYCPHKPHKKAFVNGKSVTVLCLDDKF